jgi:mannose-6-phosphate isomerase-like protein (cupin superfamily)
MPSIAIVTSANARHASSAEVTSAEAAHVTSAKAGSADTAHVSSAEAASAKAAAVSSAAATTATATAACLCTRRKQRPGKQGGCQYHHRSSSSHYIFLSMGRAISDH